MKRGENGYRGGKNLLKRKIVNTRPIKIRIEVLKRILYGDPVTNLCRSLPIYKMTSWSVKFLVKAIVYYIAGDWGSRRVRCMKWQ